MLTDDAGNDGGTASGGCARPESVALSAEDLVGFLRPGAPIERLLLAVSGGPDSVALMGLAAASAAALPPLAVATVDHGLRPESRSEAAAVAAAAAAFGLPHTVLVWRGPAPTSRIQEAARDARYHLLVAHARSIGASHFATAHTLDDQAETILYRLARGSGPAGLVGMQPSVCRDGIVHVRPLLGVRKATLIATCRAHGWGWLEDPSNVDPRYARSRWRAILPMLESEGLGPDRLATLSMRLSRAEAALDRQAERVYALAVTESPDMSITLDARALMAEPEEIVLRVLARSVSWAGRGAAKPAALRLQRLERLVCNLRLAITTGSPLKRTLAGAIVWARSDGTIRVGRESTRRSSVSTARSVDAGNVDHEANCIG